MDHDDIDIMDRDYEEERITESSYYDDDANAIDDRKKRKYYKKKVVARIDKGNAVQLDMYNKLCRLAGLCIYYKSGLFEVCIITYIYIYINI